MRREKIRIMATKLPKMGGQKKKKKENCGKQVAKNLGRNLIVISALKLPKMRGKKKKI